MIRFVLTMLFCLSLPLTAWAGGVALVIGNSKYANVSELDNPGNDALAVAEGLRRQGFNVLAATDLNRVEMRNALRDFRRLADEADVALVYYAGHGIEIAGVNYLVPVDARLEDERDAGLEMVEVDLILRQISGAKQLKMVVLDACRNNPFVVKMRRENAGRNVGNGLGRVDFAQPDTLIAYAAAAGEITPDGTPGGNSPFTRAFLNALQGPPADVRRLLGRARDELRQSVPGAAPFIYTSLGGGEMVINPLNAPRTEPAPRPETATGSISEDFVRIDRDGTIDDWNAFLVRWEDQSNHPLYAFALEKREALKPTVTARNSQSAEPAPEPETAVAAVPTPTPTPAPEPEPVRTRDEAARALQTVMKERGCYRGGIDGILGRGSQRGLTAFGGEIGETISLNSRAAAEQIEAAIATFMDHPDVNCPVVAVRTAPAKPKPKTTTATTTQRPAAEPVKVPEPEDSSTSYGRDDATKLQPVQTSDCIGNRRKFYDCD